MTQNKVYQKLASSIDARLTCIKRENEYWETEHFEQIHHIMTTAPSGSGIDSGTTIDLDKSTGEKLVFHLGYHHMNDWGYYDGWTDHTITVRPSFRFNTILTISGPNRDDVKDYLHEIYHIWLNEEVPE